MNEKINTQWLYSFFSNLFHLLTSLYQILTAGLFCRSFAKPPKQVQVVCECILVLRGYKDINWISAKGMMSEANFLRSLMEMDCDSITNSQVSTVKGIVDGYQTLNVPYDENVFLFCFVKFYTSQHYVPVRIYPVITQMTNSCKPTPT